MRKPWKVFLPLWVYALKKYKNFQKQKAVVEIMAQQFKVLVSIKMPEY